MGGGRSPGPGPGRAGSRTVSRLMSARAPSPLPRERGAGKTRTSSLERTRCCGTRGRATSETEPSAYSGLQESKNENGLVFLEKHILKRKIQEPDDYVQRHTERVRGAAGAGRLQVGSLGSMRSEDS